MKELEVRRSGIEGTALEPLSKDEPDESGGDLGRESRDSVDEDLEEDNRGRSLLSSLALEPIRQRVKTTVRTQARHDAPRLKRKGRKGRQGQANRDARRINSGAFIPASKIDAFSGPRAGHED